jgi:hypothetical protein
MLIGLTTLPILNFYPYRRREHLRAEPEDTAAEFLQRLPSHISGHGTQLSWTAHPHLRPVPIIGMTHSARSCAFLFTNEPQEPRLPSRINSQFRSSFTQRQSLSHASPFLNLIARSLFPVMLRSIISIGSERNPAFSLAAWYAACAFYRKDVLEPAPCRPVVRHSDRNQDWGAHCFLRPWLVLDRHPEERIDIIGWKVRHSIAMATDRVLILEDESQSFQSR